MSTNGMILACFIVGCVTVLFIVVAICDCIENMHRTDAAAKLKEDKK